MKNAYSAQHCAQLVFLTKSVMYFSSTTCMRMRLSMSNAGGAERRNARNANDLQNHELTDH